MVAHAVAGEALLPLLEGAGLLDGRQGGAGFVEVQVLVGAAQLLARQEVSVAVPAQAVDQAGPLGAVVGLQVALQVVLAVARLAPLRQPQAHAHQRADHFFAELAGHRLRRDVEALFRPVRVVELHQQTPVVALVVAGAGQNFEARADRHRSAVVTAVEHSGIRHAEACLRLASAVVGVLGLGRLALAATGGPAGGLGASRYCCIIGVWCRCGRRRCSVQLARLHQLGHVPGRPASRQRVGRIVAFEPRAALLEHGGAVHHGWVPGEHVERQQAHGGGAELAQALGNCSHAGEAALVVVRPQQHLAPGQRGEVSLLPGLRAVGPAGGHVVGQQHGRRVGGLLAFAEDHGRPGALCQLLEAQHRPGLGQARPAPLRGAASVAAPGQRGELLARLALGVRLQVEAVEHHQRLALGVPVDPDLRGLAVLAVSLEHLGHRLGRDRQHRRPGWRLGLFVAAGRCRAGACGHAQEGSQLVAGVQVAAAVEVAHQINQVAALVAGGEVAPGAPAQVHLERAGVLVGPGRVGGGVFLVAIHPLAAG
ncbi:hypothetical protein D3C78_381790 [compost metagenome]